MIVSETRLFSNIGVNNLKSIVYILYYDLIYAVIHCIIIPSVDSVYIIYNRYYYIHAHENFVEITIVICITIVFGMSTKVYENS